MLLCIFKPNLVEMGYWKADILFTLKIYVFRKEGHKNRDYVENKGTKA